LGLGKVVVLGVARYTAAHVPFLGEEIAVFAVTEGAVERPKLAVRVGRFGENQSL
jgi:hypothetical protein